MHKGLLEKLPNQLVPSRPDVFGPKLGQGSPIAQGGALLGLSFLLLDFGSLVIVEKHRVQLARGKQVVAGRTGGVEPI